MYHPLGFLIFRDSKAGMVPSKLGMCRYISHSEIVCRGPKKFENPCSRAYGRFLPQRPIISSLCARTVKEAQRSHFNHDLVLSVRALHKYEFYRVGCCVRSSAKNQDKEKKEVLGTFTCKSKTTERAVPQIV
jgi:hypothetical protein